MQRPYVIVNGFNGSFSLSFSLFLPDFFGFHSCHYTLCELERLAPVGNRVVYGEIRPAKRTTYSAWYFFAQQLMFLYFSFCAPALSLLEFSAPTIVYNTHAYAQRSCIIYIYIYIKHFQIARITCKERGFFYWRISTWTSISNASPDKKC